MAGTVIIATLGAVCWGAAWRRMLGGWLSPPRWLMVTLGALSAALAAWCAGLPWLPAVVMGGIVAAGITLAHGTLMDPFSGEPVRDCWPFNGRTKPYEKISALAWRYSWLSVPGSIALGSPWYWAGCLVIATSYALLAYYKPRPIGGLVDGWTAWAEMTIGAWVIGAIPLAVWSRIT
jgi:hypothetical protein